MSSHSSTHSAASVASASQVIGQGSGQSASPKSIHTPPQCSESTGQTCQISETSPRQTSRPTQGQLFSLEVFHVSRSAPPGSNEARMMTVSSGRQCFEQFGSQGPLGSLERMLMGSLVWGSQVRNLTWKVKATKSGLSLFQLVPLGLTTDETESGLLPTLTVCGNYNRAGLSKTSADGLCHAITKLMPALCASDYRPPGNIKNRRARRLKTGWSQPLPLFLGVTLTPLFCERFMGYPEGWTELSPSEMPSSHKSRLKS